MSLFQGKTAITAFFLIILISCTSKKDDVAQAFIGFKGDYVILFTKDEFRVDVFNRELELVASYKAGYGLNHDKGPKLFSGDNRTPEGKYFVNEILSMDADPASPAYRKLKAMNKVFWRAREGHYRFGKPGADLGDNAYGPRFFGINYPNANDRLRYDSEVVSGKIKAVRGKLPDIGSGLAIHGNADEKSVGQLSSSGCIRMYNNDVVEIERYIIIGTPVIIKRH